MTLAWPRTGKTIPWSSFAQTALPLLRELVLCPKRARLTGDKLPRKAGVGSDCLHGARPAVPLYPLLSALWREERTINYLGRKGAMRTRPNTAQGVRSWPPGCQTLLLTFNLGAWLVSLSRCSLQRASLLGRAIHIPSLPLPTLTLL